MSSRGSWEQLTEDEIGVGAPVLVHLNQAARAGAKARGTVEQIVLQAAALGGTARVFVRLDDGNLWVGPAEAVERTAGV